MAVIYAKSDGTLLAFAASTQEEQRFLPSAPANAVFTLRFDESTNPAVVTGIQTNWSSYTLTGTVLKNKGTKVTLASDGSDFTTLVNISALHTAAKSGNLSNPQLQSLMSLLISKMQAAGLL